MATFTCPPGTICSNQARTFVGATTRQVERVVPGTQGSTQTVTQTVGGTGIYHRTVTKVTQQDQNGRVTGGETVVYIEKNGTWQPAAISKDGGKTYKFSDPNYPLMNGVAGVGLQKELQDPNGAIRKNTDVQISKSLDSAGIKPADKGSLLNSSQNSAPKDDPNTGASNPDQSSLSEADNKRISEDKETEFDGTRSKFRTDLRFPLNFKSDYQDTIKFSMVKYRPRKLETTGDSLNPIQNRQEAKDILGTVLLPIPAGISDTKSVDWASSNLDPFKAIGADIAQTSIVKGIGAGVKQLGNAATAVSENSGDAGTALANYFVEQATGAGNLLSRTQGLVINPNMELLFTGPQLRQFGFTFKLSARSELESQAILNIIRFFKQGMSPIRTKSQLFLKAPYTFQIQYLHRNKEHRYLNKIKECALQSFNVEYTPEGQYATFTSGAMVSYQITMQFSELEPIFNDEYGAGGGNTQNDSEIGY